MLIVVADVLSGTEVATLRAAALALPFEDGSRTAGRIAKGVKANEQAADSPQRAAILAKVQQALLANELFQSAARPRAFARMLLSRYRPGMSYGLHVDNAIMGGARADLSFTLMLSEAEAYDGADLVIEDNFAGRAVQLRPGDMVLYPSSSLHRVTPVSRGERLAVVGWVTSLIRDPAAREILFDLDQVIAAQFAAGGKTHELDLLTKTRSNLIRMWAET